MISKLQKQQETSAYRARKRREKKEQDPFFLQKETEKARQNRAKSGVKNTCNRTEFFKDYYLKNREKIRKQQQLNYQKKAVGAGGRLLIEGDAVGSE